MINKSSLVCFDGILQIEENGLGSSCDMNKLKRSLLAHQQELCQILRTTEKKNSRIDIVLLSETFLSKQTTPMVRVPDYTHIGNYRENKIGVEYQF